MIKLLRKTIQGREFVVLDVRESITVADSFAFNKIGSGHGEAKLYVGQETPDLLRFWDGFSDCRCFVTKSDFLSYLEQAKGEFLIPSQPYAKPEALAKRYTALVSEMATEKDEVLPFLIRRVDVQPPRVYVISDSKYYEMIRESGIPNASVLQVMKLMDPKTGEKLFYFRQSLNYVAGAEGANEAADEEIESTPGLSTTEKQELSNARRGQGKYRKGLLEECPFCPFTMVNDERLLIASHIKPWAAEGITNEERLDPKNGFMLTPTYDKLFDRGFISFKDDRTLIVSPWLSPMNQMRLFIYDGKLIRMLPMDDERSKYLAYHRNHVLNK
jgi:hypothetical protein